MRAKKQQAHQPSGIWNFLQVSAIVHASTHTWLSELGPEGSGDVSRPVEPPRGGILIRGDAACCCDTNRRGVKLSTATAGLVRTAGAWFQSQKNSFERTCEYSRAGGGGSQVSAESLPSLLKLQQDVTGAAEGDSGSRMQPHGGRDRKSKAYVPAATDAM